MSGIKNGADLYSEIMRLARDSYHQRMGFTPNCYNREPFSGRWMPTGRFQGIKPILRWSYPWFTDRCGTRAGRGIGPNGENYADAHGYACDGCRWME